MKRESIREAALQKALNGCAPIPDGRSAAKA